MQIIQLPTVSRWYLLTLIIATLLFAGPGAAQTISIAEIDPVTIRIDPERIEQGSVAHIIVTCLSLEADISYSWRDNGAKLFNTKTGLYSGFLPIAAKQKTGPTSLTITVRYPDSTTRTLKAPFNVTAKEFSVQRLTIDESKNTLSQKNLARHNSERALIVEMFAKSQPRKLWNHAFVEPLHGRLSTPFGVKRFINDQPRNPHSGVDIAAPLGTPVKATSSGIVSLTGEHFFAGNSVYIDHGRDVFSMYFHLDSIAVQDGRMVEKGDIIGHVGATGRATGPHLHWGIRIQNTPVDPFSLLTLFKK